MLRRLDGAFFHFHPFFRSLLHRETASFQHVTHFPFWHRRKPSLFNSLHTLHKTPGGIPLSCPISERMPAKPGSASPFPAAGSEITGLLARSLRDHLKKSRPRTTIRTTTGPGRFSLAIKKQSTSHWAHSAETQARLMPFTKLCRSTAPIFRRLIDEARAISR